MQIYSNRLHNSDARGGQGLDSRVVLWTPPPAPPYFKILARTLLIYVYDVGQEEVEEMVLVQVYASLVVSFHCLYGIREFIYSSLNNSWQLWCNQSNQVIVVWWDIGVIDRNWCAYLFTFICSYFHFWR